MFDYKNNIEVSTLRTVGRRTQADLDLPRPRSTPSPTFLTPSGSSSLVCKPLELVLTLFIRHSTYPGSAATAMMPLTPANNWTATVMFVSRPAAVSRVSKLADPPYLLTVRWNRPSARPMGHYMEREAPSPFTAARRPLTLFTARRSPPTPPTALVCR